MFSRKRNRNIVLNSHSNVIFKRQQTNANENITVRYRERIRYQGFLMDTGIRAATKRVEEGE